MEGPTALAEGSTPPGKRLRNAIHIFSNDLRPISQGFIVSLGVLIVLFLVYHWQMFLCCLLLLLPTARLWWWWTKQGHKHCRLDYIISSYAQGFWVLLLLGTGCGFLAWTVASIILYLTFFGLFGADSYLAWSWLVELLRWGTFCFVEELWKALFVRWDRLRRQHRVGASAKAHAVSALSLALGYATAQSLLFVVLITAILENNVRDPNEEALSGAEFVAMVFWSLFFGVVTMPLNLMGTYLTGIAISKAGEDSGECCCCPRQGSCCDSDVCGFPPGGEAGVGAFLRLLWRPVLLRTLLVVQFMLWITYLDVGLSFMMNVISIGILYTAAYRVVKQADATPTDDDIYRSVYGFQLLVDDGGETTVQPHTGGAPGGGNGDSGETTSRMSGNSGAPWGHKSNQVSSKDNTTSDVSAQDVEAQLVPLQQPPSSAAVTPGGYAAPAPVPVPPDAADETSARNASLDSRNDNGASEENEDEEENVPFPGSELNPLHSVTLE